MQMLLLILWIIPHAVLIFCVIGLARQLRFQKVPLFFTYVVYEEAQFVASLAITFWAYHGGPRTLYQWVAIVGGAGIGSCLQLAVFYEVVNTLILPRSTALATLRPLIRWTMAMSILLAVVISPAFSGLRPLTHIFVVLNFSANLIILSLLLVFFLFTRTFHISWKSLPAGIALGFGIISSVEIGATSLLSTFGMNGVVSGDLIRMSGYLVCTLVWLTYIFRHEPTPQYSGQGAHRSEIETWNEELQKIVGR